MSDHVISYVSIHTFATDPEVTSYLYSDSKERGALGVNYIGARISFHNITPESLRKLADRIYDAAEKLDEAIYNRSIPKTAEA